MGTICKSIRKIQGNHRSAVTIPHVKGPEGMEPKEKGPLTGVVTTGREMQPAMSVPAGEKLRE